LALRGFTESEVLQKNPELKRKSPDARSFREIGSFRAGITKDDVGEVRLAGGIQTSLPLYHWRQRFSKSLFEKTHTKPRAPETGRSLLETIKYAKDEGEPWRDVFDVVAELQDCYFEIPFDPADSFCGNQNDLYEHHAEMWEPSATGEVRRCRARPTLAITVHLGS
jgi:hypothetical protein